MSLTGGSQSRSVVVGSGLLLLLAAATFCIILPSGGESSLRQLTAVRQVEKANLSMDESEDHVCSNVDDYAVVHDRGDALVGRYRQMMNEQGRFQEDLPSSEALKVIPEGGKFVMWKPKAGNDGRFVYSAWSEVDNFIVLGPDYYERPHRASFEPDISVENAEKVTVQGDHFAMALEYNFASHYGHFKHDVLPILAYYKSILPVTTKFILPWTVVMQETVELIDPVFASERVHWLKKNVIVSVEGGTLTVNFPEKVYFNRFHDLWNPLRTWMKKMPPVPKQRTVLYYKRTRTASLFGRFLDKWQEDELLRRIRKAMTKYNRPEELVFFNGNNPDGSKMTPKEQFDAFRSAATVIGPHGTGVGGNLLWTDPAPKDCASRVHVLEFMTSDETSLEIHHPWISHYRVYKGLPLDYHVLLYASNSTREATYIDLDMADEFLDTIWGDGN